MQRPCGGCWATRRLLTAPPPAAVSPDQSMDAQQAHLARVLSITTTVLFVASVSYIALSTLYACLRAARQEEPGGADADGPAPPREATKRALEAIPVRVVVLLDHPRDGGCPEAVVADEGVGADADACAVCLAEYAAGDEVRVLPACRHGFHRECVDRWLLTRAPTCPVCRAPVAAHLDGADAKEENSPTSTRHAGYFGDFAAWSIGLPAPI
ncbi:probable E3 ubiquitin-protein ligase ATL44 [Aegilops tauschii subsp. strangulata]|uniref:probable E3 ubiquitin-protein ligase ATL44 n=1 Tax=Aegilops tauschii subsp. strangulata TaxID=200361 RepID=UPI001E1CAA19|nr:probable E3 ubiquitin-protein ligase ATL44 [Aegilops tauschii subsp. strangulata]